MFSVKGVKASEEQRIICLTVIQMIFPCNLGSEKSIRENEQLNFSIEDRWKENTIEGEAK